MTELSARDRLLSLVAVISSSFSIGVAFGVGFPLTTLVLEQWGESKFVIGLAGAAPAIGILIAMPMLPRVLGRFGTIPSMIVGAVLAGVSFLALAGVSNAWAWIVVRIVMSMCLAAPWLAGETWINLATRDDIRGRVIAIYAIAFFGGFTMGPLLISLLGTSGIAPFASGALGTALAAVPIYIARRLAPDFTTPAASNPFAALALVPAAMVAAFMSGFTETSYLSLIASVGLASGLSESEAVRLLSLITIGGVALQFPLGWLADKISRVALVIALAAAFILLSLLLPPALGQPATASVIAFAIGGVILGFYSIGLVILGERVAPANLASANATFIVFYELGSIAGPVTSGAAMSFDPIAGFVATVVGLMLLSAAAIAVIETRDRRRIAAKRG